MSRLDSRPFALFAPMPAPLRPSFTQTYTSPTYPTHPVPSSTPQSYSSPSSPSSSYAHLPPTSLSKPSSSRPKLAPKKSSTQGKQRNVQASLEAKVERAKGFHAFFVPLARSIPPPPPSSPVLQPAEARGGSGQGSRVGKIFFDQWEKKGEQWVEDIDVMDLDSE